MSEALKVYTRGEPVLSQKAFRVADYSHPDFQSFVDDLIQSGEDNLGVGIAAPQVGKSWCVFILAPKPSPRYPKAPMAGPIAVINPKIIRMYGEVRKDWEGCLSIPGYRGLVPRHTEIDVVYTDRFGRKILATYTGFVARIFQHEYDHLEGILYPERMDKDDKLVRVDEFSASTGTEIDA